MEHSTQKLKYISLLITMSIFSLRMQGQSSGIGDNFVLHSKYETIAASFPERLYLPEPSSPFQLKKNTEIILSAASFISFSTGFVVLQMDTLNVSDLAYVDRNDVPAFERYIIDFDSADAARAGTYSDLMELFCGIGGITSIFIYQNSGEDIITNSVMYAEGLLLCAGITEILKRSTDKKRPFVYNTDLPDTQRTGSEALQSFPSGHTSFAAFSTFFAATLASNYLFKNENTALKILTYTSAAILPAITGFFRTEAGKHFWTDVTAGYILGAGIGLGIPALHKMENENVSFYPLMKEEMKGFSCVILF